MKPTCNCVLGVSSVHLVSFIIAAVSAIPTTSAQVLTGPLPYASYSDSPFNGTPFTEFYIEDFEDVALNTPGVSASSGDVAVPGTFTDSVDADDGMIDGNGQDGHSWFSQFLVTSFTFSFDRGVLGTLPTHVGIAWTDVGMVFSGSFGIGDVSFEAFGPSGTSLGVIGPFLLGDGDNRGQTDEDRFFGVVDLGGISAITVHTFNSTDWEVDHLQYGIVSDIECDFDADGNCDIDDLNAMLLVGPVAPGVPATGMEEFDLNANGVIDNEDVDVWLAIAGIENGFASPYKRADANLDGTVDGVDFILWNNGKFTPTLLWDGGDFNGDGINDGQDFIQWNANKFTSSDGVNAVPEPSAGVFLIATLISLACGRRRSMHITHRSACQS